MSAKLRHMRGAIFVVVSVAASSALAHTPSRPEAFSVGLRSAEHASGAVIELRASPSGTVLLPASTFVMGSDIAEITLAALQCQREPWGRLGDEDDRFCELKHFATEIGEHKVTLSAFTIDRTEVTVLAFDRCVGAGVCNPPGFRRGDPRFDRANFPVTMVSWSDGADYCRWVGGALPTEAQWEYAARGIEQRRYPWGNVWNGSIANHGSLADDPTDASDGYAWVAPVGSFPEGATPTGIQDLAGNVEEWVQDRMDIDQAIYKRNNTAIALPYLQAAVTNPIATTGLGRRARGGSFIRAAHQLRATARFASLDTTRSEDTGFRCVYGSVTPTEASNIKLTTPLPTGDD